MFFFLFELSCLFSSATKCYVCNGKFTWHQYPCLQSPFKMFIFIVKSFQNGTKTSKITRCKPTGFGCAEGICGYPGEKNNHNTKMMRDCLAHVLEHSVIIFQRYTWTAGLVLWLLSHLCLTSGKIELAQVESPC